MADHKWQAGQWVIYCGGRLERPGPVRIDRVTPSGRAVIKGTQYGKDGHQIGGGWLAGLIRPATDSDHERACRYRIWTRIQRIAEQRGPPGHLDEAALRRVLAALVGEEVADG